MLTQANVQGVEEMHSQAEASSFPERVDAEASDVHSSVEHAHCLSSTRERETPSAWAAFINTLTICCDQRFQFTTTTHRRYPDTEGKVGRRCEEQSQWLRTTCRFIYCCSVYVLPCFLNCAFSRFHFPFLLPSLMTLSSPLLSSSLLLSPPFLFLPSSPQEKKVITRFPPEALHNQIFDLMKGFNYWLPSAGGVRLLLPLFIFPAIYHCPDSYGVYVCAVLFVCLCVCCTWVCVKNILWSSRLKEWVWTCAQIVVSWPFETVFAERLVGNGI